MLIEARDERLLVVSDMHVGNPFSEARRKLGRFFDFARRERFNVCINGDGFEILQASFSTLAHDSAEVLSRIRAHIDAGLKVYYVVGNHDIALEQFLHRWSGIEITPFLNISSGSLRIRIEHGHLYDPSFVRSPGFYEFITRLAGPFLRIYPDVYRLWTVWENFWQRLRALGSKKLTERSVYYKAADMLLSRGFDIVIFGHTHKPEDVTFGVDRRYINSGNWVKGGSYVKIAEGEVSLKQWSEETA
ncbi:MAG TPA: UDP-2,3-diacylglucosamine diphosphatase [Polyangiaceae bacterium]|nr:UDP-2,3-diacylglucosamine diphosphatase [Polyangiaceae bacterium]